MSRLFIYAFGFCQTLKQNRKALFAALRHFIIESQITYKLCFQYVCVRITKRVKQ